MTAQDAVADLILVVSRLSGSHGLWSTPGEHVYASALGLYKLVDSTSRGARWDTSLQLNTHAYFTPLDPSSPTRRRRRATFSGLSSWLNWRGIWGDFGQDDCWWHSLYPACQLVDGPQGPARDSLRETPRVSNLNQAHRLKWRVPTSLTPPFSTAVRHLECVSVGR